MFGNPNEIPNKKIRKQLRFNKFNLGANNMENEPRHLCMSEKRFNSAIGTNPEPWIMATHSFLTENDIIEIRESLFTYFPHLTPIDTI